MNTAIRYLAGAGTQTAALSFGGLGSGIPTQTEEYDGSSWTTGVNLNAARLRLGGGGTQTSALAFGGAPGPNKALTEEFNGAGSPTTVTLSGS